MPPTPPYAASLRTYEPLAAFSPEDQRRWADYAARVGRRPHPVALAEEVRAALASVTGTPPRAVPPDESAEAFVLAGHEGPYICPWQLRQRSWQAVDEFRVGLPTQIVDAFLPPVVVAEAVESYRRWSGGHPDARTHIRTSRWYVPVEWFTAVAADERHLDLGRRRSLVYRTRMGQARRRVARALRTLRRTVGEDPVTASVEDVARWLEEFHPRSLVELDYGGLASLLDDAALETDSSPADVAGALAALDEGDEQAATVAYRRLVDRWRRVQALEHAS